MLLYHQEPPHDPFCPGQCGEEVIVFTKWHKNGKTVLIHFMKNELNNDFIKSFNLDKEGFTDLTPFIDCTLGFSVKKKGVAEKDYVSLIHVLVSDKVLHDDKIQPKPLIVSATYGRKTLEGIAMRRSEEFNVHDPIDVEFPNEFFYDLHTKTFYRFNKKVEAEYILKRVYAKHIKTTKPIKGLITRFKIRFWWFFTKNVINFVTRIFYCTLFLISGNRYEYEPLLQETKLNGKIVSSAWPTRVISTREPKEKKEDAKKFQFLQYDASFWSIVFYSVLHMIFYVFFMHINYKPKMLATIFENNFLTLIYVIISLFIIEFVLPKFLMQIIKHLSTLSSYSAHKKINL